MPSLESCGPPFFEKCAPPLLYAKCDLTASVPPPHLQALDLSDNALTSGLPQEWSSMRLLMLNLSWNELSGQVWFTPEDPHHRHPPYMDPYQPIW